MGRLNDVEAYGQNSSMLMKRDPGIWITGLPSREPPLLQDWIGRNPLSFQSFHREAGPAGIDHADNCHIGPPKLTLALSGIRLSILSGFIADCQFATLGSDINILSSNINKHLDFDRKPQRQPGSAPLA